MIGQTGMTLLLKIVFYLSLVGGATIFLPEWFYNGFETPKLFMVQIGTAAFVFLWLLRSALKGALRITLPLVAIPLVALFLLSAASISWGINPLLGLEELYRVSVLVGFCFFAFCLYRNQEITFPLYFILFASLALAIWALMLQYCLPLCNWVYPPHYTAKVIVPGTQSFFYNPLMGNQGNPNFMMHILVLSVPLALGAFAQELVSPRYPKQRYMVLSVLTAAVILPVFCILSSQNKSGLLALFAGVSLFLCIVLRRKSIFLWMKRYKYFALCGTVALAVFLANTSYLSIWYTRFGALRNLNDITVYSRVVFLETGASMIREKPWLGQGIGQFVLNYPKHKTAKHWQAFPMRHPPIFRWADMPKQSHNEFLQVFLATGVLGLVLFLFFWIALFILVLRQFRKKDQYRYLALGASAGVFGTLVNSLFTFPLQTVTSAIFFWTTVGLLLAHCRVPCWKIRIPLKWNASKAFVILAATGLLLLCVCSSVRLTNARYFFFDALKTHAHDLDYSIQQCEYSVKLIPYHFETRYVFAFLYSYAGRYPEARQQLGNTIKLGISQSLMNRLLGQPHPSKLKGG